MVSLLTAAVLASIPLLALYGSVWDPATLSAWNFVFPIMQYLLIGGLVTAVLGLLWRGSIIGRYVFAQIFVSIGVGTWMFLVSVSLILYWFTWSESCPDPTLTKCFVVSAEYLPAELLPLGLLIPALSLISSIAWLSRHNVGGAEGAAKIKDADAEVLLLEINLSKEWPRQ